jgi:hypothetical protein
MKKDRVDVQKKIGSCVTSPMLYSLPFTPNFQLFRIVTTNLTISQAQQLSYA